MQVVISHEGERECGFRSSGAGGVGIYLMGEGVFEPCERLPFPLDICPCCGAGIKFSRSFTWINPISLFAPETEPRCTVDMPIEDPIVEEYFASHYHDKCFLCTPSTAGARAGLLWIGKKNYPHPIDFTEEAHRMGISRKIPSVPHGFEIGEHVIYLAHQRAVRHIEFGQEEIYKSGIFMVFKPQRIDLVIDDPNDIPERAINIAERLGDRCRIVKVVPNLHRQGELLNA